MSGALNSLIVIAGLDPAIHRARTRAAWMDARIKPGRDAIRFLDKPNAGAIR